MVIIKYPEYLRYMKILILSTLMVFQEVQKYLQILLSSKSTHVNQIY